VSRPSRIAVLADVHGNLPALEAAIADLEAEGVDEVLVGGDLVGRGPQGTAVVERIRDRGWPSVQGNHEEYLLAFRARDVPESWLHDEEWAASRWMAAELSEETADWIARLPFALIAESAPGLRLVHGTPASNREGIGPWTGPERTHEHWSKVDEPLLVVAHTHRPLVRHVDGVAGRMSGLVVNVGSVGLPFNRDPRAQYAIFTAPERDGGEWGVELRQVEYAREDTLDAYESSGFLEAGGVTARLLQLELEHAVPFLVPFLEWTRATGRVPALGLLDEFREVYDGAGSLREFFVRIRRDSLSG
jgi:predicted phosphodiesterase